MFLMLSVLISSAISISPMDESDKRAIRKELYSNYQNNCINKITLAESGLTLEEVIDRDIQILVEHEKILLKKINVVKNNNKLSFSSRIMRAGFFGNISAFAWAVNDVSRSITNDFTENGELYKKTGNWWVDNIGYYQMTTSEYKKLVRESFKQKLDQDSEIRIYELLTPISCIIALISGGLCLKVIYNAFVTPIRLVFYFEKIQKRFDRDQAIIVQLKEIKHTLVI